MRSLYPKIVIISIMMLCLLIPVLMVKSLAGERKERKNEVLKTLERIWGKPLYLSDPYLQISPAKKEEQVKRIIAENTETNLDLRAEIRSKGIYKLTVFQGIIKINGTFRINPAMLPLLQSKAKEGQANLDLIIPISNKTSSRLENVLLNSEKLELVDVSAIYSEIALPLKLKNLDKPISFSIQFQIKGIEDVQFLSLSKKSTLHIKSNWADPNFMGAYLPLERNIGKTGFEANWEVNGSEEELLYPPSLNKHPSLYGVNFFLPVDVYQQTERSMKYALLFIFLTFLTFFLFEILNNQKIHPMQYLLVGFALTLFYLLLLSLSEHSDFLLAYIIATLATVSLITLYSSVVLKTKKRAGFMGGLLVLLYSFLFVLLQLEEYSLLIGSAGLFFILALVMYLTRNVDWYALSSPTDLKRNDNL
ncbi:MAG: inner membrane CreD family protein [Leptospiraceae bacterium]|nr:inner membrane CreD family protein [Leptospiraceae bacterium]MCP5500570.1 inner membrane CreD family protein [Leptospiraceae bacterium]